MSVRARGLAGIAGVAWLSIGAVAAQAGWKELAPGLDLGTFVLETPDGNADLQAVRVDAARWDLGVYCASEEGMQRGLSARSWASRFELVAVINAGMFATDFVTHVGHLRNATHVNNAHKNAYRSVAAFRPRREGLPPFLIEDLDRPEAAPIDSLIRRYECVVQNLRLVKRPGENRWTPQDRRWSEAALGEDDHGRALFLFCRTPFAMHDFNALVLGQKELHLVAAQHLEGGPQAQMYVNAGGQEREWVGGLSGAYGETEGNRIAWPVPNVIGVRRKP